MAYNRIGMFSVPCALLNERHPVCAPHPPLTFSLLYFLYSAYAYLFSYLTLSVLLRIGHPLLLANRRRLSICLYHFGLCLLPFAFCLCRLPFALPVLYPVDSTAFFSRASLLAIPVIFTPPPQTTVTTTRWTPAPIERLRLETPSSMATNSMTTPIATRP